MSPKKKPLAKNYQPASPEQPNKEFNLRLVYADGRIINQGFNRARQLSYHWVRWPSGLIIDDQYHPDGWRQSRFVKYPDGQQAVQKFELNGQPVNRQPAAS